jgi:hypothetical protein
MKRFCIILSLVTAVLGLSVSTPASAITNRDKSHVFNDTPFYDPDDTLACGADPSTEGGGTISLVGNDNEEKAFNFFVSKGLTKEQSAGIVGNLMQESNVNPKSNNTAAKPSGRSPSSIIPGVTWDGGGIAQWEGGRWTGDNGFLAFVAGKYDFAGHPQGNGKTWNILSVQLDYMWWELNHTQKGTLDAVKSKSTPAAAAQAFEVNYERAGQPEMANRVRYAEQAFARYGKNTPTSPAPTPNPTGDDTGNTTVNGDANTCSTGAQADTSDASGVFLGDTPCGDTRGTTQELAKRILACDRITFQTPQKRQYFQVVATSGTQPACGGVKISAKLLGILLSLTEKYQITLGVFASGHACNNGFHPKGMAVDLNGAKTLDGKTTTSNGGNRITYTETGASMTLLKNFYQDIGKLLSTTGGGGMGQQQCFHGPAPKVSGVVYFDDTCNHIHMDIGKR